MADHGHAVNRDLISLGFMSDESLLGVGDFVSIVIASPPGSATRFASERGWSQTDLLLAQQNEQKFGLQYERPGAPEPGDVSPPPSPVRGDGSVQFSSQTIDEFTARRARDVARAAELAASESVIAQGKGRSVG